MPLYARRTATESPNLTQVSIPMNARKAFFSGVIRNLKQSLPSDLARFRSRGGEFDLIKIWYDHYRVHYEVVLDQKINKIEIGLHFEDGPASSAAFLALLDARILEIKDRLGHEVELERWTQSWARIFEHHPLIEPDARVIDLVSRRTQAFIEVLQPIVASSGVRLERPES
jgi:hypothetical protein